MMTNILRPLLRTALCLGILVFITGKPTIGQTIQPEWDFVRFLIDKENYHQVLTLLNKYSTLSAGSADSLNFYRGWTLYNLKELEQSNDAFTKVSSSSALHIRSGLFGAWNYAYQKNLKMAGQWLSSLDGSGNDELTLIKFEKLGLYLLERDFSGYQKLRPSVPASHYAWSGSLLKLDNYALQLSAHRQKKPVISGLLSAVIPGLGKIYTGQTGSGISAFLICGALGAMTVENGIKTGWGHWSTLVFGSLFTLFYTGNIYGSIISAKEVSAYYNEDMDQRILLDMHLPVREFYR
jgi:TM2 domain-containing membrane protein YozV